MLDYLCPALLIIWDFCRSQIFGMTNRRMTFSLQGRAVHKSVMVIISKKTAGDFRTSIQTFISSKFSLSKVLFRRKLVLHGWEASCKPKLHIIGMRFLNLLIVVYYTRLNYLVGPVWCKIWLHYLKAYCASSVQSFGWEWPSQLILVLQDCGTINMIKMITVEFIWWSLKVGVVGL